MKRAALFVLLCAPAFAQYFPPPGTAGGGVCPAGSAGDLQKTNGTNCAAAPLHDNGSIVTTSEAVQYVAGGKGKQQLGSGAGFASDSGIGFSNNTDLNAGAFDVGLLRNAAGVLEVNSNTPGAYRDLKLRSGTFTGLAGSGTQCATIDNNGTLGGAGAVCGQSVYTASFTSQTSITLSHNLGTNNLAFACFNAGTPPVWIEPNTVTETDTNTVTITFTASQSGHCTLVAQGGGASGGGVTGVNVAAPITTSGGTTPTIGIANVTGDSGSGGAAGAVPAPAAGDAAAGKILGAGGLWIAPAGKSTTIYVTNIFKYTGNHTVTTDFLVLCDATSGVNTQTLPASPVTGQIVHIKKIDSSGNPCIVDGNGKSIDDGTFVYLNTLNAAAALQYDGTTGQWWVE